MKIRNILMAAVAVLAAGCSHNPDGEGANRPSGVRVSVEATTADGTRTEYDAETNTVTWEADDQIAVAAYAAGGSEVLTTVALSNDSGAGTDATFTGVVSQTDADTKIPSGATYDYVSWYPADKAVAVGKQVQFTLANNYTITKNSLNGKAFALMVAASNNNGSIAHTNTIAPQPTFGFKQVLSYFEIPLRAAKGVKSIKITAPTTIAGTIVVNGDGSIASVADGSNTITVNVNVALAEGDKAYVPFIPCTIDGELRVALTAEDGTTHEIVKTLNKTFGAAKVVPVGGVGFHEIELASVKTYVQSVNGYHDKPNGAQIVANVNCDVASVKFYAGNADKSGAVELTGTGYSQTLNDRTATLDVDLGSATYEGYVWAVATVNGKEHASEAKYVLIPGPVSVSTSAYTSYSDYTGQNGQPKSITDANKRDPKTIYAPTAKVSIANAAWIKSSSLTLTQSGVNSGLWTGTTSVYPGDLTGQPLGQHDFNAKATVMIGERTFDLSASNTVHITGLPYTATPPTEAGGWTKASWNVEWNGDHVKIGGVSGSGTAKVTSPAFHIPADIDVSAWTDFLIDAFKFALWYNTTFTVKVGGSNVISQGSESKDERRMALSGNGTMTSSNNKIECQSSYEAAGPYVKVYSLKISYR